MPQTPPPTTRHRRSHSGFSLLELMIVVAMALIVAGFAIPNYQRAMRNYRLMGDARSIGGEIQLAKMRAAANFTRARVRFNTAARTYRTELWCQAAGSPRICTVANQWVQVTTGGNKLLSTGINFGVASQSVPPPGTQTLLAQPMPCRIGVSTFSPQIIGTSCIVFNSRGYPVNGAGVSYGDYGIYITEPSSGAVLGTTVSRTGLTATWRHDSQDTTAASWFRY